MALSCGGSRSLCLPESPGIRAPLPALRCEPDLCRRSQGNASLSNLHQEASGGCSEARLLVRVPHSRAFREKDSSVFHGSCWILMRCNFPASSLK
ncbi:unnamed protein product [Tetraodon nigroviridis]|uniref:(spotted green pufferfish) hypothetical protein n=1 Tax=Tetraodon nigroviridis TaxID=99883 RepID=Q4RNN7_TETNG|nr:unnamed protein product [Tetraodon nigroviridis]